MSGLDQAEQSSDDPARGARSIAPEVLSAVGHESDPVVIARCIADDVPAGTASPSAVVAAIGDLEDHALVTYDRERRWVTRTERGRAVAFVAGSPRRTLTLFCHVHHGVAVSKRVADRWVRRILTDARAAWLPDVGDDEHLGPYNPLGRYVDDDGTRLIEPTQNGRDLAGGIHHFLVDLTGSDPAWERAKEVVADGD